LASAGRIARGGLANGAWPASGRGLGSGCPRCVFEFRDANEAVVAYPEKGSFGVGPEGTCADSGLHGRQADNDCSPVGRPRPSDGMSWG